MLEELEMGAPSRFLQATDSENASKDANQTSPDGAANQTESEEAKKMNFNFWTY